MEKEKREERKRELMALSKRIAITCAPAERHEGSRPDSDPRLLSQDAEIDEVN